jgi:Lar family restriction alleviation protein
METELEPCPFCGGKAEVNEDTEPCYHGHSAVYHVHCKKCPTSFGDWSFNNKRDVISAWNKRAVHP